MHSSTTSVRPERRKPASRTPNTLAPPRVRPRPSATPWIPETLTDGVGALPGWKDLAQGNERALPRNARQRGDALLAQVSTARFALVILAIALVMGFYVRHVYATQEALSRLEGARKEQLRLTMKLNRLHAAHDQMIGPAAIYERARALGLVEDIQYGPSIVWERPE